MRPADFVFRYRFFVFAAVFFVAFSLTAFDPTPTAVVLARAFSGDGVAHAAGVHAVFAVGAALVVAAAALRTWATAYLRSSVVHDAVVHHDRLVADGPYRHLRNPLYLGALLMAAGFTAIANPAGAVVMVGGVLGVVLALVAVEERALVASMPERFAAYRAAVPALVPALTPRLPAGGGRPAWAQAFAGEAFFWAFALAAVTLAVTLDGRWAGALSLVGIALSMAAKRWPPRTDGFIG